MTDIKSVYRSGTKSSFTPGGGMARAGFIYLDSNASTPLLPEVRDAMEEFYFDNFANSSSSHGAGKRAGDSVEKAREVFAAAINASPREIIFTSGASESLNLAIFGTPGLQPGSCAGKIVVTSAIEHHASLYPALELKKYGAEVITIKPRENGVISPEDLERTLAGKGRADLVSIMMVNNETGAVQPISDMAKISKKYGATVLCDAVQGFGKLKIDAAETGADMMAFSAHKFYGPKGAGALYVKRGTRLLPRTLGGGHESGLRAGTVNTPAVYGMAVAAEAAIKDFEKRAAHYKLLRDYLHEKFNIFKKMNVDFRFNVPAENSVTSTVSVSFRGTAAESLLEKLSAENIMVSAGSACNSAGGATVSHVIEAMGMPLEYGMGAIRISLGIYNEIYDIDLLTGSLANYFDSRSNAGLTNK